MNWPNRPAHLGMAKKAARKQARLRLAETVRRLVQLDWPVWEEGGGPRVGMNDGDSANTGVKPDPVTGQRNSNFQGQIRLPSLSKAVDNLIRTIYKHIRYSKWSISPSSITIIVSFQGRGCKLPHNYTMLWQLRTNDETGYSWWQRL